MLDTGEDRVMLALYRDDTFLLSRRASAIMARKASSSSLSSAWLRKMAGRSPSTTRLTTAASKGGPDGGPL